MGRGRGAGRTSRIAYRGPRRRKSELKDTVGAHNGCVPSLGTLASPSRSAKRSGRVRRTTIAVARIQAEVTASRAHPGHQAMSPAGQKRATPMKRSLMVSRMANRASSLGSIGLRRTGRGDQRPRGSQRIQWGVGLPRGRTDPSLYAILAGKTSVQIGAARRGRPHQGVRRLWRLPGGGPGNIVWVIGRQPRLGSVGEERDLWR